MPTPSVVSVKPNEPFTKPLIENDSSDKSRTDTASDPEAVRIDENYQKKKYQMPQQQIVNYNASLYPKIVNRSTSTNQNGGRHNRNNSSANKRSTSDPNNNYNPIGNKQFSYKGANLIQQKMMHDEHQKLPNGHVDPSKKPIHKFRSITKNNQAGSYNYDEVLSHNSAPEDSSTSTSPNLVSDVLNNITHLQTAPSTQGEGETDALPRKYSMDFLHQVGYEISGNVPTINVQHHQPSPKTPKHMDDANLVALKLALGDNSNYYNHFVATSMYGNQIMIQQQQFQQQPFTRFQQNQHQQQQMQRLQRMYQRGQQESYPRMYHHPMYQEQDVSSLPQTTQQVHRSYSHSYSNSPSYQNRNKGDRRDYRDNSKKNRNDYHHGPDRFQNGDRNFRNRNNGNRGHLTKSHSMIEDGNRVTLNRNGSGDHVYRSLSPTPPSSSKSSSPGAQDKPDVAVTNSCNFDVVDDSASTASASSSDPSGSTSYVSDMKVSLSAPVLLDPQEPSKDINLWIDNNFSKGLHSGHSVSAEHLNIHFKEPPVTIIKRPPSENGAQKKYSGQVSRYSKNPPYDPQYPFEYYLSRSDLSEMRAAPSNLRCRSQWDQMSDEMWQKFQLHQQSRQTYRKKMYLWRDLYNSVKSFPLFHQKAFPKWGLFLVGSTISGFGSDTSDIDMCLVSKGSHDLRIDPRMEAMVTLNDLKNFLTNSMSPFQSFSLINAKVPILRFRDASNTIEIDLNYNNCVGVRNTHLLYSYTQLDWRLRPLALIVKLWAQYHNINDARNSTISSYSLVLMVIHFLQYAVKPAVLPCLHSLRPDSYLIHHDITTIDMVEKCDVNWKSDNRQPLGELFIRCLDYYSNFDYANNAISIRTGGVLPIEDCKNHRSSKNDPNHWQTLCIEEPFDRTNTARSAYDCDIFLKIKSVFFQSFHRLNETQLLESVFTNPLFTQQQQQQMSQLSQMKYMGISAGIPVMSSVNDNKS